MSSKTVACGSRLGRDVGRDGLVVVGRDERLRDDEVADPQPGRDRLRERRRERDPLATLELVDRRQRLAVVADAAVRVVLENRQIVRGGELDEPPAALGADRAAGRVLEGRDRVEERDRAALRELGLERVEVEPLVVHRERHHLGALAREDLQRPVVRRPLDEHATRPHGELDGGVEDEALQAARRQEDAAGLDAVALREHLAQRAVATARAVGEHRDPVPLERRAGTVGDQGRVEAFRGRSAAGKRDRCHVRSLPGRLRRSWMRTASGGESGATATVIHREWRCAAPGRSASFDSRLG